MDNPEWRVAWRAAFGARIRRARGQRRQADLAERLGVSVATVSEIERGARRVSVDELIEIALALDVAPEVLIVDDQADDAEHARRWVRGQTAPPGMSVFAKYRFFYENQTPERKATLEQIMGKMRAGWKRGALPDFWLEGAESTGVIGEDDTLRQAIMAMLAVEYATEGTMFGQPAAGSAPIEDFQRLIGMTEKEELS